jgi:broad specificity phosphatase PhoE
MLPKRIYLIRHGESEGNVDKQLYKIKPDWKMSLTKKGKAQAFKTSTTMIYTSPWYRARQTADIINSYLNCKLFEDPRLREQSWGNYQEDYFNRKIERERHKFGSFYYSMSFGESGANVYDRISTFLETLYRDFQRDDFPENVVIVAHGLTNRIFIMRWFHWSVEEFEIHKTQRNCEILRMTLQDDNRYKLITPLRKRVKNA